MTDVEKYPHVRPWQFPVVEKYEGLLVNTGGNDALDLLNDMQRPGTDTRPNRLMSTNVVRFTLAVAVQSQVQLLHLMDEKGMLTTERTRLKALYIAAVPSTEEHEGAPAKLACPYCGATGMYEVDIAVRWTEVEYGVTEDPALVHVSYDGHGDYESDHLRCMGDAGHELDYPSNWREIVSEN